MKNLREQRLERWYRMGLRYTGTDFADCEIHSDGKRGYLIDKNDGCIRFEYSINSEKAKMFAEWCKKDLEEER